MTGDRLRITDQMPSAQRMSSVVNPCCSGIESFSVFTTPPRLLFLRRYCYASNSKNPVAISLAFDHRCYRGLTTASTTSGDQQAIGHDRHEADQHRPQRKRRHQKDVVHALG